MDASSRSEFRVTGGPLRAWVDGETYQPPGDMCQWCGRHGATHISVETLPLPQVVPANMETQVEKEGVSPKATQPVKGSAGIWTQVCLISKTVQHVTQDWDLNDDALPHPLQHPQPTGFFFTEAHRRGLINQDAETQGGGSPVGAGEGCKTLLYQVCLQISSPPPNPDGPLWYQPSASTVA